MLNTILFVVTAELGDYDAGEHGTSLPCDTDHLHCDLLPPYVFDNSSYTDFILKVREHHKAHAGQTPADAELHFLKEARKLTSYGVYSVRARDTSKLVNPDVVIGVSHAGVLVFRAAVRTGLVDRVAEPFNSIDWTQIVKISFKRKQFVIEALDPLLMQQPQIVVTSGADASVEQQKICYQQLDLPQHVGLKSSEHRHLRARNSSSRRRRRLQNGENVAGLNEPEVTAAHYHGRKGHQQMDSGLHSTSTVSSSGCGTSSAARGGISSQGDYHYERSSRSSSVYSANNPESDGGDVTTGCFVNMVSIAKLRGAATKQSVQNSVRSQTRRSTTDSGESEESETRRSRNEAAIETDVALGHDAEGASQQEPTTYTYILESAQACKALWKQCKFAVTFLAKVKNASP